MLIERIRERWHPLHNIRKVALFRAALSAVDIAVWGRLDGIKHPVRMRLARNLSYLLLRNSTEPGIIALFLAVNKVFTPRTFWDVGANIGYYGWLLKSQRPQIEITLFEPDPINLSLIEETRQWAGPGVRVVPSAVSSQNGEAIFASDGVSGATGSLEASGKAFVGRHYGVSPGSLVVQTVTLDTIRLQAKPVEFMKIDVEGHEAAVIKGAEFVLDTDMPVLIFESFHQDARVFEALRNRGYCLFDAERMSAEVSRGTNFLALPPRLASRAAEVAEVWRHELQLWHGQSSAR